MDFIEEALKKHRIYGLDEIEVYSVASRRISINASADKVKEPALVNTVVHSVRGATGHKAGNVAIRGDVGKVEEVMSRLKSVVNASSEDRDWPGFPPDCGVNKEVICYDDKTAELMQDEKALLELFADIMEETRRKVVEEGAVKASIVSAWWSLGTTDYSIANSNGVYYRSPCTFNNLAIQVKVSTERGTSDWTFYSNNRRVDLKELYEAIDRESAIAVLFGGSKPVKSGKYNIILYNNVLSNLLSDVLVPALSALNVLHRRSPLRDKLQQAIFSEKISLSDDPTLRLERGSRPFDDEGVSTNSKALVDRGTLKNFLHNYYTSRKFNAQGSGNGFRRSPEVSPTPMPTNLVLKGDSGSIEEFIKETSRGLVIYDVIGQWMSNPVTGYIKANITHGLLVESGEISQAVKGSIVVGNIYEWLGNSLDNLGSDTKVYSGVAAPSAVIRSVDVGGE